MVQQYEITRTFTNQNHINKNQTNQKWAFVYKETFGPQIWTFSERFFEKNVWIFLNSPLLSTKPDI